MKIKAGRPIVAAASFGLLVCGAEACSSGDRSAYARAANGGGVAVIEPMPTPYVPRQVGVPGTILGFVQFIGPAPRDTVVTVTRDQRVCGNTIRQPSVRAAGNRLAGALVWLSDIREGRPLPLLRRFELVQNGCTFDPLIQPVIAGGALNVRAHDAIISRSVVVDTRTLDTLAVLPFTDAGEVIPLDVPLRQPALLEVGSTTHPWMRAWVAVFDQPYFVESGTDGAFRLDGIPPGTYTVRAWHPRFGVTSDTATVAAGAADTLTLSFQEPAAAAR
jgi:hypothetical protein